MKGIKMAKSIQTLRKSGLPYKLNEKIVSGSRKTISEWAEEFDVFPTQIQAALGILRKLDLHYHPVGTITSFDGESKQGVVVDVMSSEELFSEIYDRRLNNSLIPGIKDFHKKTAIAIVKFPGLKSAITSTFNTIYSFLKGSHDVLNLPNPREQVHTKEQLEELMKQL